MDIQVRFRREIWGGDKKFQSSGVSVIFKVGRLVRSPRVPSTAREEDETVQGWFPSLEEQLAEGIEKE